MSVIRVHCVNFQIINENILERLDRPHFETSCWNIGYKNEVDNFQET